MGVSTKEILAKTFSKNQFPSAITFQESYIPEEHYPNADRKLAKGLGREQINLLRSILHRSLSHRTGIMTHDPPDRNNHKYPFLRKDDAREDSGFGNGFLEMSHKNFVFRHELMSTTRTNYDKILKDSQTNAYFLLGSNNEIKQIATFRPLAKSVALVYIMPVIREMSFGRVKKAYIRTGEKFSQETHKKTKYVFLIKGAFGPPGISPRNGSTPPQDYVYLEVDNIEDVLGLVKLLKLADKDEISSRELLVYLLFDQNRAEQIIKLEPGKIKFNPIITGNDVGVHFVLPDEVSDLVS